MAVKIRRTATSNSAPSGAEVPGWLVEVGAAETRRKLRLRSDADRARLRDLLKPRQAKLATDAPAPGSPTAFQPESEPAPQRS